MTKKSTNKGQGAREAGDEGQKTPGAEAAQEAARGDRTAFDSVRENIEALIIAVILAVVIRHFTVEAFEIPTGSMANTLYGLHAWLDCPNCLTEFNVSLSSDRSTGQVNVPYREMWIHEGACENPACALRLHSRGPNGGELAGPGATIGCGACGTAFQRPPGTYRRVPAIDAPARCPICHFPYVAVLLQKNKTGGHKILVNKFAYSLGSPARWDVIVFEFDQWVNYIKRLVGLPGERVQIWDGDIYINGKIERKSAHHYAQDVLWTRIADSDVAERGLPAETWWPVQFQTSLRMPPEARGARWSADAWAEMAPPDRALAERKNAQWNAPGKRWSVNALKEKTALEYRRGFDNYYNYNLITHGSAGGIESYPDGVQVGDKKVAFTVTAADAAPPDAGGKGGWVGGQVRDGDFAFELRIPVGSGAETRPAVLERVAPTGGAPGTLPPGPPLRAEAMASIPLRTPVRVELENADDRVAAKVDGKVILVLEYTSLPAGESLENPPESPGSMRDGHYLRILVNGAQVEISSIQVYRDMYYIAEASSRFGAKGVWPGIQLGPGEYFAMGDNAPSSADGRSWGSVPGKNLMGKGFLVIWPAWPTNFQWKFIR